MDRKTRMMALLALSVSFVAASAAMAAPAQQTMPTQADVLNWIIDTYGGDIEVWYIEAPIGDEPDTYGGGNTAPEDPSLGGSGHPAVGGKTR